MLALQRSTLQGATRLVAFEVIARGCASPTRPVFFEALPSLAERVGLSLRKVRQVVRQLEACGLLVRDTEGPPHGGAVARATRYRVRVEALEAQPAEPLEAQPVELPTPPVVLPEAVRRRALPPPVAAAPLGVRFTDELPPVVAAPSRLPDGPQRYRYAALEQSNKALVARGLSSEASPFESAAAALWGAAQSRFVGNLGALVEALGPERAHDLAQLVRRRIAAGGVKHPAALLVSVVKADAPDAWHRYRAGSRRTGTRAQRQRQRDPAPQLRDHADSTHEQERNAR